MSEINLHNMDCMEFMSVIPDKKFTLSIADPVYGIDGNSHRNNKSRGKATLSKNYHAAIWDMVPPNDEFFNELYRVSKNQIIWGGNYFPQLGEPFKTPRRNEYEAFIELYPTNWIIWDKVNGTTSFNDCELAWTSVPVKTDVFKFMWSGMMQGSSFLNGTRMNPHKRFNEVRIHPTQKPVELYKYLLKKFTTAGDVVFDPYAGSFSIGIACDLMNIDLESTEIEPTYYQNALKRFNLHKSQQVLQF